MSRPEHRARRSRSVLVLSVCLAGCGVAEEGSLTQDVALAEDAQRGPEAELVDVIAEVVADSAEVVSAEVSSPDVALDTSADGLDSAPSVDAPEGKAIHGCEIDSDCGGCAGAGTCTDGRCVYEHEGCVIPDLQGGFASCYPDDSLAPGSTCLHCRVERAADHWSGVWYAGSFESGLDPFVWVETFGAPEAMWRRTESEAYEGTSSARFGQDSADNYVSSGRSWGRMKTGSMSGPSGVSGTLRFWLSLETEETLGYDILTVLLLTPEGEQTLWSSEWIAGTTADAWQLIEIDVQGPPNVATRLALEFDSVDGIINRYRGPRIDGLMLSTNCCLADGDCVAANVCVTGACGSDGQCQWAPVMGCCYEADHCPSLEPCMRPTCSGPGGTCGAEPIADCCIEASDCDDADMCTLEICAYPGALCESRRLCCTDSSQCVSTDPCFQGSCEGNECVYVDRCCDSTVDCDDGNACTVGTCFNGFCLKTVLPIEGCCIEDIFVESFDTGLVLDGWSFQGITSGVGWTVEAPPALDMPSPPAGLYYGNPSSWTYNSGGPNEGKVWTPFLLLPSNTEIALSFDLFLDVQEGVATDLFTVLVHGPSGWEEIVEKPTLLVGQWQQVVLDVSALGGHAIQLAFEFKTITGLNNNGQGVFVDDLKFTTTCSPRPCESTAECPSTDSCVVGSCSSAGRCEYADVCCHSNLACDDANPCTVDSCVNQHCENSLVPVCCASSLDCDDGDLCTLDVCTAVGGACFFPLIDGCCHDVDECDDGDVCTLDQCLDNVCAHVNACCLTDADCDDGDDICTVDDCVDGFCSYGPTGLEGCCLSQPTFWDFESPLDFTMTATSPPCGWQITDTGKSSSGAISMYYGDLTTMTFACGHNAGTATSPDITLMPDVAYSLIFDANLDVESNTVYDTLDLFAVIDGQEVLLWDKFAMIATDSWYPYTVDLSALAGRTFKLRFSFNTHDEFANDSTGIYIDDLEITSSCLPKPCVDDPGCDDGVAQTLESCGLAGCEYVIP
jgi:hypothetical protein